MSGTRNGIDMRHTVLLKSRYIVRYDIYNFGVNLLYKNKVWREGYHYSIYKEVQWLYNASPNEPMKGLIIIVTKDKLKKKIKI